MTCSECLKPTTGQPVVIVCVVIDDQKVPHRFTGIVWHADCAPIEREYLKSECRAIQRAQDAKG